MKTLAINNDTRVWVKFDADIYFRIPFTEYYIGRDKKLCLFRKIFSESFENETDYEFIKV